MFVSWRHKYFLKSNRIQGLCLFLAGALTFAKLFAKYPSFYSKIQKSSLENYSKIHITEIKPLFISVLTQTPKENKRVWVLFNLFSRGDLK